MRRLSSLSLIIVIVGIGFIVGASIVAASIFIGGGGNSVNVNLQKGLVGWWKMDGDANDSTSYQNDGTLTGTTQTTDRKGTANKAYSFNGTTNYISVADSSALKLTSSGAVSAWINLASSPSAFGQVVGKRLTGGTAGFDYMMDTSSTGTKIRGLISNGTTTNTITGSTVMTSGIWYHLVFVWDGSNLRVYVNGVSDATAVSQTVNAQSTTHALEIGRGNDPSPVFFKGSLDDVRIYNRALSATEVTALYEEYNPGVQISDLQKGLIGQWKMDGDANDSTSYQNDGTVTGATLTTDRKGTVNKAYSFNGTSDFIGLTTDTNFPSGTNARTVSAWVKISSFNNGRIFAYGTWSAGNAFELIPQDTSKFMLVGHTNNYTTTNTYSINTWYNVVAVFSGTNLKFYVNGNLDSSQTVSLNTTLSGLARIGRGIGSGGGGSDANYLNGTVDDVRIYNRALSATEVTALYEEYNPGVQISDLQKGLIGQWKMDGDANDSTSYQNDGTVTGATLTTDRKGQTNKAYSFNGTSSDYASTTTPLNWTSTSAFSFGAWLKLNDNVAGYMLASSNSVAAGALVTSITKDETSGKVSMIVGKSGTGQTTITSSTAYTTGSWEHYVAVYNGANNMTLYRNGVSVATGSYSNGSATSTGSGLYMMYASNNTNYVNGSIDDVRAYNRALSAAEVLALYQSY